MKEKHDVIIIGGGLSGLTLSYLLSKQNKNSLILEASSRLGGRIHTIKGKNDTPLELGATWFSDAHSNIISLLDELGISKYPQFTSGKSIFQSQLFAPIQEFIVPNTEAPTYRIAGGTQEIIDTISKRIDPKSIRLNTEVISITENENILRVDSGNGNSFLSQIVVLCMPPQLVHSKITFSPKFQDNINNILPSVQTWMAGSIKFVLEYAEPFWRNNGFSGMLYSHTGIISEMYDHTNIEENKFGFTGFLNSSTSYYSKELRKKSVLQQLDELLGKEASSPLLYNEKIWDDKYILNGNQLINRPHQNNGHPLLQKKYMNGKLLFSGTETSPLYPGYMDGAILSAKNALTKILH